MAGKHFAMQTCKIISVRQSNGFGASSKCLVKRSQRGNPARAMSGDGDERQWDSAIVSLSARIEQLQRDSTIKFLQHGFQAGGFGVVGGDPETGHEMRDANVPDKALQIIKTKWTTNAVAHCLSIHVAPPVGSCARGSEGGATCRSARAS